MSSNDASPCGDMMHLLRKYDVAPFGRNDALFAQCAVRQTSLGEAVIIGVANIICVTGKHHSKNAPLSVDKSAFFVGGDRRTRTAGLLHAKQPLYQLSYTPETVVF